GGDGDLHRAVGVQVLGAHVDLDVALEIVDAPALRELLAAGPTPECFEGMDLARDADLSVQEHDGRMRYLEHTRKATTSAPRAQGDAGRSPQTAEVIAS